MGRHRKGQRKRRNNPSRYMDLSNITVGAQGPSLRYALNHYREPGVAMPPEQQVLCEAVVLFGPNGPLSVDPNKVKPIPVDPRIIDDPIPESLKFYIERKPKYADKDVPWKVLETFILRGQHVGFKHPKEWHCAKIHLVYYDEYPVPSNLAIKEDFDGKLWPNSGNIEADFDLIARTFTPVVENEVAEDGSSLLVSGSNPVTSNNQTTESGASVADEPGLDGKKIGRKHIKFPSQPQPPERIAGMYIPVENGDGEDNDIDRSLISDGVQALVRTTDHIASGRHGSVGEVSDGWTLVLDDKNVPKDDQQKLCSAMYLFSHENGPPFQVPSLPIYALDPMYFEPVGHSPESIGTHVAEIERPNRRNVLLLCPPPIETGKYILWGQKCPLYHPKTMDCDGGHFLHLVPAANAAFNIEQDFDIIPVEVSQTFKGPMWPESGRWQWDLAFVLNRQKEPLPDEDTEPDPKSPGKRQLSPPLDIETDEEGRKPGEDKPVDENGQPMPDDTVGKQVTGDDTNQTAQVAAAVADGHNGTVAKAAEQVTVADELD